MNLNPVASQADCLPPQIKSVVAICLLIALILPSFGKSVSLFPSGGDERKFEITSQTVSDGKINIDYYIPFPGLLKVYLLDSRSEIKWRGQYVNDKIGMQKISFSMKPLTRGERYTLRFEFKKQVTEQSFTAP